MLSIWNWAYLLIPPMPNDCAHVWSKNSILLYHQLHCLLCCLARKTSQEFTLAKLADRDRYTLTKKRVIVLQALRVQLRQSCTRFQSGALYSQWWWLFLQAGWEVKNS